MTWSFQIGRAFGIPLRVHLTYFLLLLYLALFSSADSGMRGVAGMIFIVGLFACVVIHELAHSLVASRSLPLPPSPSAPSPSLPSPSPSPPPRSPPHPVSQAPRPPPPSPLAHSASASSPHSPPGAGVGRAAPGSCAPTAAALLAGWRAG